MGGSKKRLLLRVLEAKEVEAPESECSIYNFTKCNGFERGSSTQNQIPLLVWEINSSAQACCISPCRFV